MMQRFESLGYQCHVYDFINMDHIHYAEADKQNVVAFLFSYTAEKPSILHAAETLSRSPFYKTESISSDIKKILTETCNICFPLSFIESELELKSTLYINTIMFIFDCIFASLIPNDKNKTE